MDESASSVQYNVNTGRVLQLIRRNHFQRCRFSDLKVTRFVTPPCAVDLRLGAMALAAAAGTSSTAVPRGLKSGFSMRRQSGTTRKQSRGCAIRGAVHAADQPSASAAFVGSDGIPFFALSDADRASELRADAGAMRRAAESKQAVLLPLSGGKVWVIPIEMNNESGDDEKISHVRYRPATALLLQVPPETLNRSAMSFLGFRAGDNAPIFCADVSDVEEKIKDVVKRGEGADADNIIIETSKDAKAVGPNLPKFDAGILAAAAGLLKWQQTVRFCSECGSRTKLIKAGHKTQCLDEKDIKCPGVNYPKLMPAVLTLTTCGDYCLLGRNSKWPRGFYSCLAGFVDQSESLEQAAAREVLEESGIEVLHNSTKFVSSQPWPFPNQLMVGFRAEAEEKTITIDDGTSKTGASKSQFKYPPNPNLDREELKDARWFHKDWLREQLGRHADPREDLSRGGRKEIPLGSIALPGTHALARHLVEQWVLEESGGKNKIPVVAFAGGESPPTLPPTNRSHVFAVVEFLGKGGGSTTAVRFQPTGGGGSPTKNDHERLLTDCEREASRLRGLLAKAEGANLKQILKMLGGGQIDFTGGEVSESAAYDDEREACLVAVVRNGGGGDSGGVEVPAANQEVLSALLRRQYPMHDVLIPGIGQ